MTSFAADRSRRTTETDRWLAEMLGAEPGVALVAVGGYGRKELLPGSDLDVLMLHEGREDIARSPTGSGTRSGIQVRTLTTRSGPSRKHDGWPVATSRSPSDCCTPGM